MHNIIITFVILSFLSLKSRWNIPDYHSYESLYALVDDLNSLRDTDPAFAALVLVSKYLFLLDYDSFRVALQAMIISCVLLLSYRTPYAVVKYLNIIVSIYLISVYLHGQLRQGFAGMLLYLATVYRPSLVTGIPALITASMFHFSFLLPILVQKRRIYISALVFSLFAYIERDRLQGLFSLYLSNSFDLPTAGFFFRFAFFAVNFFLVLPVLLSAHRVTLKVTATICLVVMAAAVLGLTTLADRVLTVITFMILGVVVSSVRELSVLRKLLVFVASITAFLTWLQYSEHI